MKILTRMSILLFALLLAVCVGSVSILSGLVRDLRGITTTNAQAIQLTSEESWLTETTRVHVAGVLSLLDAEYRWLRSRLDWVARDRDVGRVLTGAGDRQVRWPLLEARLDAARADLAFLVLVRPDGTIVEPLDGPARPRRPSSSRRGAGQDQIARSIPKALEPLLENVLPGKPRFEVVPLPLGPPGAGRSSTFPEEDALGEETVVLAASVAVHGEGGDVRGIVLGGVALEGASSALANWTAAAPGAVRGIALCVAGTRRLALGGAFSTGTEIERDIWEKARGAGWAMVRSGDSIRAAVPIAWAGAVAPMVLEVSLPAVSVGGWNTTELTAGWESRQNRAVGLLAMMAVLALAIGIEGARRMTLSLARLRKRANLVSTGKVDASFKDLSGKSDVGELARCFERMRISIRKLMDRRDATSTEGDTEAPFGSVTGESRPVSGDDDA